ncbi:hypothetical protein ACFWVU_03155 [Streptomyces sp. NPDC058686]|uniref:hypothetical protein n=1 Tax=Streptomyces sp. NPDC058686 TaxID=3346599 RepID=UPI00365B29A4
MGATTFYRHFPTKDPATADRASSAPHRTALTHRLRAQRCVSPWPVSEGPVTRHGGGGTA